MIDTIDPKLLVRQRWNPQQRTPDEKEALKRSILAHGFVRPVLARRSDRAIVDGHGRLEALSDLRALGHDMPAKVPVAWWEGSDAQLRALTLALNNIQGSADIDLLGDTVRDINALVEGDVDLLQELLGSTGYPDAFLDAMLYEQIADEDIDGGDDWEPDDAPAALTTLSFKLAPDRAELIVAALAKRHDDRCEALWKWALADQSR